MKHSAAMEFPNYCNLFLLQYQMLLDASENNLLLTFKQIISHLAVHRYWSSGTKLETVQRREIKSHSYALSRLQIHIQGPLVKIKTPQAL